MKISNITKKIRLFSLISFIIPLIVLSSCLVIYKILGNYHLYPQLTWDKIENETAIAKYDNSRSLIHSNWSFTNCPKYKYTEHYISKDGQSIPDNNPANSPKIDTLLSNNQIKSIIIKKENEINNLCIKNNPIVHYLLIKFNFLEKTLVKTKKLPGVSGQNWSVVKNPYLYGEVLISRTARYYPANLIFKPFIILTALFLFFYWYYNLAFFNQIKKTNLSINFSRRFFYFGVFSCFFLIMHAIFLGVEFNTTIFNKLRRLILFLFIIFEVIAQIALTFNMYKIKKHLINYINPMIFKIKICFVSLVFISTILIFSLLFLGYLNESAKHIIEWNYFTILLLYYFISRFLWKN